MTVSRPSKKKLETWVPHGLTETQLLAQFETRSSVLLRNRNDLFLSTIWSPVVKSGYYTVISRDHCGEETYAKSMVSLNPLLLFYQPAKHCANSHCQLIFYGFIKNGLTLNALSWQRTLSSFNHRPKGKEIREWRFCKYFLETFSRKLCIIFIIP